VSCHKLLAKIPSLPLALEVVHFQSLGEIHDQVRIRTKTDLKIDSFVGFESCLFMTTK